MKIKIQIGLLILYISVILIFSGIYYMLNNSNTKHFNRQLTYIDCFYFSTTTMSTSAYGDITATSDTTKLLVSLQLILSVTLISIFVIKTAIDFKYKSNKKKLIKVVDYPNTNLLKNKLKNIDEISNFKFVPFK